MALSISQGDGWWELDDLAREVTGGRARAVARRAGQPVHRDGLLCDIP
jgi:hypothetical protein